MIDEQALKIRDLNKDHKEIFPDEKENKEINTIVTELAKRRLPQEGEDAAGQYEVSRKAGLEEVELSETHEKLRDREDFTDWQSEIPRRQELGEVSDGPKNYYSEEDKRDESAPTQLSGDRQRQDVEVAGQLGSDGHVTIHQTELPDQQGREGGTPDNHKPQPSRKFLSK